MMMQDTAPAGKRIVLGDYHFSAEKIIEFATQFDPQYFHTDPTKAKESALGGLCASGWHVCAAWMQVNIAFLNREFAKLAMSGLTPPKMGPAMGFRDLRWSKPVFAGDTITYSNTYLEQFALPNRDDRVLNEFRCDGVNQNGDAVISFIPKVIEFV